MLVEHLPFRSNHISLKETFKLSKDTNKETNTILKDIERNRTKRARTKYRGRKTEKKLKMHAEIETEKGIRKMMSQSKGQYSYL